MLEPRTIQISVRGSAIKIYDKLKMYKFETCNNKMMLPVSIKLYISKVKLHAINYGQSHVPELVRLPNVCGHAMLL